MGRKQFTKKFPKTWRPSNPFRRIFFNTPLIISNDDKHSRDEKRYLALGITNKKRFLTVIFTLRESDTLIRIISSRDQHQKERIVYAKAT